MNHDDEMDDKARKERARLEKCRQTIEDFGHKFDQPVDVVVTIACDGRLSFYAESSVVNEDQFMSDSLEVSFDAGVHLLGYFKATITMGEWTAFTREQQDQAIERYVDKYNYRAEKIAQIIDRALEQYGE